MAKPRASSGRALQMGLMGGIGSGTSFGPLLAALSQLGIMGGSRPDGLRPLATNNRNTPTAGGMPNPFNLSGVPLMQYWSSLDANTPDKIATMGRVDEMYGQYRDSPYAKWLEGLGVAPGMGSVAKRADRFNEVRGYPTGKIF